MKAILGVITFVATIVIFILTCFQFVEVPEAENAALEVLHDAAVKENLEVTAKLLFRTIVGVSISALLFFTEADCRTFDKDSILNMASNNNIQDDNFSKQKDDLFQVKQVKANDSINKEEQPKLPNEEVQTEKPKAPDKKVQTEQVTTTNIVLEQSSVEQQASKKEKEVAQIPQKYTAMKKELIQTGKEYIKPSPKDGKNFYWNNHVRGEIVSLDCDVDGVSAKSMGRVLGVTSNMRIDVQFENEDGTIKVISVYNNNLTVLEE